MVTTLQRIQQNLQDVTPEQIGRCHRIIGQDGKAFYLVENESGKFDEHGCIEYKVAFSRLTGFTCTCPSGRHGFYNVRHVSGVCKHIRWAVAASMERKAIVEEPIEKKWNMPAWMLNPNILSQHRTGTAKADPWID